MKAWRSAALAGALAAAAWPALAQTTWWLKPPPAPDVTWRGMLPTEGSGVGIGPQIGPYIVPGPAGLLVAIFTHAAISQGVQSAQRQREQEEADKVLAPYLPALRAWPATALWEAARAAAPATLALQPYDPAQAEAAQAAQLEVAPVFTLSQDEGVLIADVAIKRTPVAGAASVDAVVRVVSSPHDAADARSHWSGDEARRLKDTAARMLAHALDVADRHAVVASAAAPTSPSAAPSASAPPSAEPAPRTYRYLQGSVERSERAVQLGGDCSRAVLRTLRGGLLSVPLKVPEGTDCRRTVDF